MSGSFGLNSEALKSGETFNIWPKKKKKNSRHAEHFIHKLAVHFVTENLVVGKKDDSE